MTGPELAQRDATAEESERWSLHHANGYAVGLGDGRCLRHPGVELTDAPAELPGETGTQYVARHVRHAWRIGYARGYRWGIAHPYPWAPGPAPRG